MPFNKSHVACVWLLEGTLSPSKFFLEENVAESKARAKVRKPAGPALSPFGASHAGYLLVPTVISEK